jgi:hypothetical protein
VAALLALLVLIAAAGFADVLVGLPSGDRARLTDDSEIFLEAMPRNGEGMLGFAQRLTGSPGKRSVISEHNRGRTRLLKGVRYKVPLDELTPQLQLQVMLALFPEDRALSVGWRHEVAAAGDREPETLWTVARWFTGRGEAYRELRDANGLRDTSLVPGQPILVPAGLLRPSLRAALPEKAAHDLEYGEDELGSYGVYKLKRGKPSTPAW